MEPSQTVEKAGTKLQGVTPWEFSPENFFVVNQPEQIGEWLDQNGLVPAAAVLGCAAYGVQISVNELVFAARRVSGADAQQKVIFAVDPELAKAVGGYYHRLQEKLGVGVPEDLVEFSDVKIAMVGRTSGDVELMKQLIGRLSMVLVTAPDGPSAAGQLGDGYLYLKPGGIMTVILRARDFCMIEGRKAYDSLTVERILKGMQRTFLYDPVHSTSADVLKTLQGAECSMTHLTHEEYREKGYPSSRLLSTITSTITGENELITILTLTKPKVE